MYITAVRTAGGPPATATASRWFALAVGRPSLLSIDPRPQPGGHRRPEVGAPEGRGGSLRPAPLLDAARATGGARLSPNRRQTPRPRPGGSQTPRPGRPLPEVFERLHAAAALLDADERDPRLAPASTRLDPHRVSGPRRACGGDMLDSDTPPTAGQARGPSMPVRSAGHSPRGARSEGRSTGPSRSARTPCSP